MDTTTDTMATPSSCAVAGILRQTTSTKMVRATRPRQEGSCCIPPKQVPSSHILHQIAIGSSTALLRHDIHLAGRDPFGAGKTALGTIKQNLRFPTHFHRPQAGTICVDGGNITASIHDISPSSACCPSTRAESATTDFGSAWEPRQ